MLCHGLSLPMHALFKASLGVLHRDMHLPFSIQLGVALRELHGA